MNFSPRSAPTRPLIELRSLRRSLNTPVLAIAELPVGPGSAAIALHVDSGDGSERYTLAVRCERSREVVFFSASEEDLGRSEPDLVGEAVVSLAESMGFLFEEDLPSISAEAAALIWKEFVGSADPSASAAAANPTPLLTKFRRPHSWIAAGSAVAGASEADPQRAASGATAGFEMSDTQIAG